MANQTHHIQQQLINLDWFNVAEPHRLKDQLATFARQQLLPQMELVFDEFTRNGRLIQFDKVVIDLGDIYASNTSNTSNTSNWQQIFCEKFVIQLKEQLSRYTADTQLPGENIEDEVQGAEIIFKQFLFFLHYGRLPWWGATRETAVLRKAVSRFTPAQWRHLGQAIDKDEQACRRLIVFCDDEQLERYCSAVFGLNNVAQILLLFVPIPSNNFLFKSWRHYCWSKLFELATAQRQPKMVSKCLQELLALLAVIASWTKDSRQVEKTFELNEKSRQAMSALPEPWRTWISPLLKIDCLLEIKENNAERLLRRLMVGESFTTLIRIITQTSSAERLLRCLMAGESFTPLIRITTQAPLDIGPPPESSALDEAGPAVEKEISNITKSTKNREKAVESPISVAAAGMVIVHPFIQELFREQSLLTEHDFRSEECRHTGVHMLAYLAFGNLDIEEYDLLLAKLLCAMPWEHSLPPWELADEQRKACDKLLIAALHHWAALKSRSVQFLRQQFFWRNGKLKTTDDGWQLTIEKRAQDILLDRLPWGVGVIRMPWMKKMLYVNWDT
jgi:hypothetical protein